MPIATVNGIDINYSLEGDGARTIVLVNGLADDLTTWELQMADLLAAGYQVLRYDNRGVGLSSAPPGPYTSRLLADDAKALVDHLGLTGFHLMGVSMGGMIAQEYALAYPDDLVTVTFACTYAAPGPFCSRMFSMWHDMAPVNGVPFIMRDVFLWAFTVPFFEDHPEDAADFEAEMAAMTMSDDAYLAQLEVIRTHDTTDRLGHALRADARARRRGGHPHPGSPVAAAARPRPRRRVGDHHGRSRMHVGAPGGVQQDLPRLPVPTLTNRPTAKGITHERRQHNQPRRRRHVAADLHPTGRPRAGRDQQPARPARRDGVRRRAGRRSAGQRQTIAPGRDAGRCADRRARHARPGDVGDLHRSAGLRQHLLQAHRHRHRRLVLWRPRHRLDGSRRDHVGVRPGAERDVPQRRAVHSGRRRVHVRSASSTRPRPAPTRACSTRSTP